MDEARTLHLIALPNYTTSNAVAAFSSLLRIKEIDINALNAANQSVFQLALSRSMTNLSIHSGWICMLLLKEPLLNQDHVDSAFNEVLDQQLSIDTSSILLKLFLVAAENHKLSLSILIKAFQKTSIQFVINMLDTLSLANMSQEILCFLISHDEEHRKYALEVLKRSDVFPLKDDKQIPHVNLKLFIALYESGDCELFRRLLLHPNNALSLFRLPPALEVVKDMARTYAPNEGLGIEMQHILTSRAELDKAETALRENQFNQAAELFDQAKKK